MQRFTHIITAWASGYIIMILNYFKIKAVFLMSLFPTFEPENPEHWEILSGTIMNFFGALSFVVGIYLAWKYGKKK